MTKFEVGDPVAWDWLGVWYFGKVIDSETPIYLRLRDGEGFYMPETEHLVPTAKPEDLKLGMEVEFWRESKLAWVSGEIIKLTTEDAVIIEALDFHYYVKPHAIKKPKQDDVKFLEDLPDGTEANHLTSWVLDYADGMPVQDLCAYATPQPVLDRDGKLLETISEERMLSDIKSRCTSETERIVFASKEDKLEYLRQETAYLQKQCAAKLREYPVCKIHGEPVSVLAKVAEDTKMVTAMFVCERCRK